MESLANAGWVARIHPGWVVTAACVREAALCTTLKDSGPAFACPRESVDKKDWSTLQLLLALHMRGWSLRLLSSKPQLGTVRAFVPGSELAVREVLVLRGRLSHHYLHTLLVADSTPEALHWGPDVELTGRLVSHLAKDSYYMSLLGIAGKAAAKRESRKRKRMFDAPDVTDSSHHGSIAHLIVW